MQKDEIINLELKAKQLRKNVLDLTMSNGEPHLGGCFSEIEILVALYKSVMSDQDKFLLSKGHGYYPLYLLLKEKGYNPELASHNNIDPQNGIENTGGSYGHGMPMATGMAFAKKIKKEDGNVYVLMSESDIQEGTTWESALIAVNHALDNLTVVLDFNKIQAIDETEKVLSLKKLSSIFESIGFCSKEIDGHDFGQLLKAFHEGERGKPKLIVAHTIKGKGVSFMENDLKWHSRLPDEEQLKQAYEELS